MQLSGTLQNRRHRRKWDNPWVVILFVLPAIAVTVGFIAYPAFMSAFYSLFDWEGLGGSREFIGLQNWSKIITDPVIRESIFHNVLFIVVAVFIQVPFAFTVALLLTRATVLGRSIYRVAYFLPVVLSVSVVGVLWTWVYNPQFGLLNELLRSVGLGGWAKAWLGRSVTVLPAVILAVSWQVTGFYIVVFLSALAGIPEDIYDAATIDGANLWQLGIWVVGPMLREVFTVLVAIAIISSVKRFDLVYIMTQGGPVHSTEVLATYLFKNAFLAYKLGYASTISFLLFLLTLVLVIFQLRSMRSREIMEY
jgi:raffinose/stachyose/melibiose transport system permease protein